MGQIVSTLKSRNEDCARRRPEGGLPGGQTPPRRGQTLARVWVLSGPTRGRSTPPLRPYNLHIAKTLDTREKIHEKFRSLRHQRTHFEGFCSSSRHPAGGRN